MSFGHGQACQPIRRGAGCRLTKRDRIRHPLEIGRADVAHLDVDTHVALRQRSQLQRLVCLEHHVRAATQQLRRRLQLLALRGRLHQVDHDDDVRAQLARHVHRDVAHHAAVRKDVLVGDHWRKGAGDRHACAHRRREVALVEHHHLAGDHVGRNGAERDRQAVEARLHAGAGDVGAQQVFDAARVDDAARHDDALVLQSKLEIVAVGHAGALLLDRLQVTLAESADDGLPVNFDQELLQCIGRDAGRVACADQRAHAGARDAVDRHAHFLEHLQHADVRAAFRPTSGEYQADARPVACWRPRKAVQARGPRRVRWRR